ncbi:MAG: hypothetical protein ACRC3Y_05090 [Romboutsia sp.]|uniref:hypothetical protein n=1 Tax=Romboutsia sp. TaxID=1965302 RepID=UPI003F37BCE0
MAQETWGLKLDAELKEKVQEIIKNDFDSSKDFLDQVVSAYELNKLKQGDNVLTAEIDELESLTRRINGIFINANAKINTMLQDKDTKSSQQVELKSKLIERLQGDITKLEQEKEEISLINDKLVNLNSEYLEQVNQFTKSTDTLEKLVLEYKEKNDTLTGLLAEYKQDREKNRSLEEELKEYQQNLHVFKLQAQNNKQDLDKANEILQDQADKHKNDVEELLRKQCEVLDTVKSKAEIDANMTILGLQQEHQTKMQALQEKHNIEIEQYQNKYKELLEKLEEKKTTKTRQTKTKENKAKDSPTTDLK